MAKNDREKAPRCWIALILERQPNGEWAADMAVDGQHVESFPAKPARQLVPLIAKALVEHMVGREPEGMSVDPDENKGQRDRVEHTPEGA